MDIYYHSRFVFLFQPVKELQIPERITTARNHPVPLPIYRPYAALYFIHSFLIEAFVILDGFGLPFARDPNTKSSICFTGIEGGGDIFPQLMDLKIVILGNLTNLKKFLEPLMIQAGPGMLLNKLYHLLQLPFKMLNSFFPNIGLIAIRPIEPEGRTFIDMAKVFKHCGHRVTWRSSDTDHDLGCG